MSKKVIGFSAVAIVLVGVFLWFVVQDRITADTTAEWDEQKFVVTSAETDVEGLEVEASIVYTEGASYPCLELSFTNNGKEDMCFGEERIYLNKNDSWGKAEYDGVYESFLLGHSVLCPESVEIGAALSDGEDELTNTYTMRYYPWDIYQSMDSLGEYRFELEIHGKDGASDKLGTVCVEWTQQLK